MMRICEAVLESVSPYSQSKYHDLPRLDKELPDAYDERTWPERMHANDKGEVFIPPMAFKNALSEIAKFLGQQIPGKGKSTFTKHFEAGVMVSEPLYLGIKKEEVPCEILFVPADGRRGSGSRVKKRFPLIKSWGGKVTFYLLDETVTPDVFEHHLREAGNFIGIGRFRPRNNGFYGRFRVVSIMWKQVA